MSHAAIAELRIWFRRDERRDAQTLVTLGGPTEEVNNAPVPHHIGSIEAVGVDGSQRWSSSVS